MSSYRGVARIWNKYLKISWKFLTLMKILDNDVYRKINIASEKVLNYGYFKFASLLGKDWNFGYAVFYF